MKPGLRIGELAKAGGVSRDTIRYYERVGLLPSPRRSASAYRLYDDETLATLKFIRGAQALGLTLGDIRDLLHARSLPAPERCRLVSGKLQRRIEEHDRKIATLRSERTRLKKSIERCERSQHEECPLFAPLDRARRHRGRETG